MKDLTNIKLLILDCDGVLTDGKIFYDDNKRETKAFDAKDGLGIKMLDFTKIMIAVITGRNSTILARRCRDLKIKYLFQGIKNKRKKVSELLEDLNLEWGNVAYMGDDWNDFSAMQKAYFKAVPKDVMPDLKEKADFISSRKGGYGAVRDLIEYILKKRNEYDKTVSKLVSYLDSL